MSRQLDSNYNSLDRVDHWDSETQKVIQKRIARETGDSLSYKFFSSREGEILELLVDTLIPQERNKDYIHPIESRKAGAPLAQFNRVKISELIDRNLAQNIQGVRYGQNPWPREFYQQGLVEIEKFAKTKFEKLIEDFSEFQLNKIVEKIFGLDEEYFLRRFLQRVLSDATAIYFSHPASWNQIGFPGPAYPEGYPFLDCGKKEDWEPSYRIK